MLKRGYGGAQPGYYYAVVFIAAVLIFAQGYYIYHRSLGPTDGVAWSSDGRVISLETGGPGQKAGLRVGDQIVALDGVSNSELLRRWLVRVSDTYHVGDHHAVKVVRAGQMLDLEYVVESNYRDARHFLAQMFGNLVALAFLAIGLGVFLLKPADGQVVLFCLSFAAVSTFFGNIFPVYLRRLPLALGDVIWLVQTTLRVFALPLMLHFFFTFPTPVGLVKRWPRLTGWIYIPFVLIFPMAIIGSLPLMYNFEISPRLRDSLFRLNQLAPVQLMAISYFLAGAVALAANYRAATSPDHRRRMRVLMVGTVIGFAPLILMIGLRDPARLFASEWEALAGLVVLVVPLCFAYTIIKHRLFDLRLVIRRSIQYALARHVLFAAFISPIAILVIDIIAGHQDFLRQYIQEEFPRISLYLLVGAAMLSIRRPLRNWLDRKFFREAYDARKILSELAEEIGLMVNIDELVSMVMRQINDSLHIKYGALLLRDSGRDYFHCVHYLGAHPCTVTIPAASPLVKELRRRPWRPLELRSTEADEWLEGLAPEDRAFVRDAEIDLIIPLRLSRDITGLMLLGEKQSEEPYSKEDKELLLTVAAQTALGVERARLSAEMAREERLKREVEIAQEVQARLFPQSVPRLASLDIAGVCLPAQGVAGDYYDFLPLAPGRLGVAIGDISGKGISAALLMANLQATLRSQAALAGDDVARLLGTVNKLLFHSTSKNKFATLFYATYDDATRRLTYVNAGHNGPLLVRGRSLDDSPGAGNPSARTVHSTAGGNLALAAKLETDCGVQRLETGGTVIGAFESPVFEQETIRLDAGDLIVAYTDGIVEARSPDDEVFGEEHLERLVQQSRDLSASQLVDLIIKAVSDFTRGAEQHDDVTLVVMRIL
ncbi:MAG: SpoIIE family protein phosphatase [Acidobacteria bacterium]|nr:SpoIIE family protein phosphatase [Acidobacteriota bacterium]